MKRNALTSLGAGLALLTVAAAPTAFGALVSLPNNNSISLDDSYLIDLTGKTPVATQTTPFADANFAGTLKSDVYNFDAAGAIFVYTVTINNVFTPTIGLEKLSLNVDGFSIKVGGVQTANNVPGPKSANVYSGSLTFDWDGTPVLTGKTDTAVVQTLGTQQYLASSARLDPYTTANTFDASVAILGPVPEPTTMAAGAMLLLPFAASTLRMIRRKNA